MGVGRMRYKELVKRLSGDVDVEIEGKGSDVIIKVHKHVDKKKAINTIPAMF